MTKKSDKADLRNDPRTQLFVYGLDEAGKPKGARFLMSEMETVFPVVTAQKLQFFDGGGDHLLLLVIVHRVEFAIGAEHEDAVDAAVDKVIEEPLEPRQIEVFVGLHRRGDGRDDALDFHALSFV